MLDAALPNWRDAWCRTLIGWMLDALLWLAGYLMLHFDWLDVWCCTLISWMVDAALWLAGCLIPLPKWLDTGCCTLIGWMLPSDWLDTCCRTVWLARCLMLHSLIGRMLGPHSDWLDAWCCNVWLADVVCRWGTSWWRRRPPAWEPALSATSSCWSSWSSSWPLLWWEQKQKLFVSVGTGMICLFKGQCREIPPATFFILSNPIGPLIDLLKHFIIWPQFREEIHIEI